MSLPRFFLAEQVLSDEEGRAFALRLADDDLRHVRALRLAPGERIAVIDGASDYFECMIEGVEGEDVRVSIAGRASETPDRPRIALFQALPKQSKLDEVVRHATEVGVDAFHPFSSRRCVMRLDGAKADKRVERWRAIAKSAAMQAGRDSIPSVNPVATFEEALVALASFDAVLVFWEEAEGCQSLHDRLWPLIEAGEQPASIAIVIGSEGGFEREEVERLAAASLTGWVLSLGDTILRTETAGIVAPALVAYELGGLGRNGS